MTPSLRMPFPSLSCDDLIARGAAGHVFRISPDIVLKCPTKFDDPFPQQVLEMEESAGKIETEKRIYRILMEKPHPNIMRCILAVSEGIFMPRMECTLQDRLSRTIPSRTQEQWVLQLTSALAWLEGLGFVHGDLRPANALIDSGDNLHLADFDAVVKPGEELLVASEPFCRMNADLEPPPAGPATEQFALASTIYTIRFGHWPWHELEPRIRGQRMIQGEFPPVLTDSLFGEVVNRCWRGKYESVSVVAQDVRWRFPGANFDGTEASQVKGLRYDALRVECERFIAKQAGKY